MTTSPARRTTTHTTRRSVLHGGIAVGATTVILAAFRGIAEAATGPSVRSALATSKSCATITKSETQGPFWVDEKLNRSDIRADSETGAVQAGIPLTLTINLQDAGASCTPQAGAFVDIWHANAQGAYSDVSGSGNPDNIGVDWLRGYQVSDSNGQVTFTTIYPGWYVSRTIHIHFRVRVSLDSSTMVDFTSQLFFDEATSAAVVATPTYSKSGTRTRNSTDNLYDASLLVPLTGSTSSGYAGAFTVNLDFGDGAPTTSDPTSSDPTTDPTETPTTDPTTEPTADPTADPDVIVQAAVTGASVSRKGRARILSIDLKGKETVAARVQLVRHDDLLAQKTTGWLRTGSHTVNLRIPDDVAGGRAQVVVTFVDKARNAKITEKRVTIPRKTT